MPGVVSNAVGKDKPYDVYRDSLLRYLGYANEVGESFRALIHVNAVRLSYVIAAGYCLADTGDKAWMIRKSLPPTNESRTKKVAITAADTLTWQLLASVIIPGFTINRICALSLYLLKTRTTLPLTRSKWITTGIGLLSIPVIIKPIDHSVDYLMDQTLRKHVYKLETDLSHQHED